MQYVEEVNLTNLQIQITAFATVLEMFNAKWFIEVTIVD